jgi:hypothetical protein
MKAKTGFFQELQGDGSIANSSTRLFQLLMFMLLCSYMYSSISIHQSNVAQFISLLKEKSITEQTFITLMLQTKNLDWDALLLLVSATVVPKVIQKFAEARTGIKDTTETSTETASSKQVIKTT